eukprot:TRINITY_DN10576_c0_g2_i2.p1 TRINITY_DN10576_c0_g2~~TRINITY_DN10576_c0_g2_i2.p1  ORF type:complete len:763 (+),score=190.57 TRINITY_DN10576_c0_g2_i2:74-2362(+)
MSPKQKQPPRATNSNNSNSSNSCCLTSLMADEELTSAISATSLKGVSHDLGNGNGSTNAAVTPLVALYSRAAKTQDEVFRALSPRGVPNTLAASFTPPRSRQTSQLPSPRAGHPSSALGSGCVTPTRHPYQGASTSPIPSRPSSGVLAASLNNEIKALEARLMTQVANMREGSIASVQNKSSAQEASLHRLEQRMLAFEVWQTKFERRTTEMNTSIRTLSEEHQVHEKRVDSSDARLWQFRHEMEEEFQKKLSELEHEQKETMSKCRVMIGAIEDNQKRLTVSMRRWEKCFEDQQNEFAQFSEEISKSLDERLSEVESSLLLASLPKEKLEFSVAETCSKPEADDKIWELDRQMSEVVAKFTNFEKEAIGEGGYGSRLVEHEVRIAGLRNKLESQDELLKSFDDRIRLDWESRLETVRKTVQDLSTRVLQSQAELQSLASKVEGFGDESRSEDVPAIVVQQEARAEAQQASQDLVDDQEAQDISENLTESVSSIVEQLRAVVPKVIEHEASIRELREFQLSGPKDEKVSSIVEELRGLVPKVMEHETSIRELREIEISSPRSDSKALAISDPVQQVEDRELLIDAVQKRLRITTRETREVQQQLQLQLLVLQQEQQDQRKDQQHQNQQLLLLDTEIQKVTAKLEDQQSLIDEMQDQQLMTQQIQVQQQQALAPLSIALAKEGNEEKMGDADAEQLRQAADDEGKAVEGLRGRIQNMDKLLQKLADDEEGGGINLQGLKLSSTGTKGNNEEVATDDHDPAETF